MQIKDDCVHAGSWRKDQCNGLWHEQFWKTRLTLFLILITALFISCSNSDFKIFNGSKSTPVLSIAGATPTTVTLAWSPPSLDAYPNDTYTYTLAMAGTSGSEDFSNPLTSCVGINVTACTVSNLTSGGQYFFKVQATDTNYTSYMPTSNEVSTISAAASIPSAPANLTATAGNGQVSLTWNASTGATGYNVYYSQTPGGPYLTKAGSSTNAYYMVTGLTNGMTYYFVVTAVNAGGESRYSNQATATPFTPVSIPSPPTNLTATPADSQITLSWNASTGATGYNVYDSTSSAGSYAKKGSTAGTSYTVTGLTNGAPYYFTVTAVNSVGESAGSNITSATPFTPVSIPSPPTNLTATPGNDVVYLTWNASTGATSYNAYGATSSSGPWVSLGSTTSTSSPVTGCLNNGTVYYFTVTAVNSAGESGPSNVASSVAYISNTYLIGPPSRGIAIDASGNAWIVNPAGSLYKVTPSGYVLGPLSISSYNEIESIAIDASGNLWVTEMINSQNGNSYVIEVNSSGSVMGTYLVGTSSTAFDSFGIAIDSSGNIWIADSIGGYVPELNSSGSIIGNYQAGVSNPSYLAIDKSGNIWTASNYQSGVSFTIAELNSSGSLIHAYTVSCGQSCKPEGIAIDASGNVWIANQNSNSVVELTSNGSLINAYPVGTNPNGIAIDASGNVWVANGGSSTLTELNSSGTIIGTYSTGTSPNGIAIDASGNVWVTSNSNVTELVGVTTGPQYFPYTGPIFPGGGNW